MRAHLPLLTAAALCAAACAGNAPMKDTKPDEGYAAVIYGARFMTPAGETKSGLFRFNMEGAGGRSAVIYRMTVRPAETVLHVVEPDFYRLSVTRNILGFPQPILKVRIAGRTYRMPFPRDVLRKAPLNVKGKKVYPMGVFEVRLQQALPGQTPQVKIFLEDSVQTRRTIVQDVIHQMMDPRIQPSQRDITIGWARALQTKLLELLAEAEAERVPLYKTP
ncbi:MAG: hypothetical protein HY926_04515 [Elusimicrobia bacterium]|nr:hypothetical protein [Elusimicrobiota bacterium]